MGTWVADGLNDEATKSSIAKKAELPDFVDELIKADKEADLYLVEQRKTENYALVFKDPEVILGKHFNDYCNRNTMAYRNYKTEGINNIAKDELKRYDRKIELQDRARRRGIKDE